MNLAPTSSCLTSGTWRRLHRSSIRAEAFPRPPFLAKVFSLRLRASVADRLSVCPRFASQPHGFLVNYGDPILHRVGPAGHFPHSTQGPRS